VLHDLRHVSITGYFPVAQYPPVHACLASTDTLCQRARLPIAFYLKLFSTEIGARERLVATSIMGISTALSIIGTIFAFLPKSLIGAE